MLLAFVGALASCGPHMYKTQSGGKDNVSYITVVQGDGDYRKAAVVVNVDGREYPIEKVYKLKNKRKAHPIVVEPGKHNVKIIVDGREYSGENIIIGLQETKMIVLR